MNGSTQMIGLIVALIITTGGVVVLYETSQTYQQAGKTITKQGGAQTAASDDLVFVNVVATNISEDGVKYVHFQMKYEGDGVLSLNDTFIQLRTDKSVTDLQYRNGTTNRSTLDGFYTQ